MHRRARLPVLLAWSSLALAVACPQEDAKPVPAAAWLKKHRARFSAVRDMMVADGGAITSVGLSPLGALRTVAGAKGSCGSKLRSGRFPWECRRPAGTEPQLKNDLEAVAAFLGVAPDRLVQYRRTLPVKSVSREGSSGCSGAPEGSVLFWRQDTEGRPGRNNILWSRTPPGESTCPSTCPIAHVSLGEGWYEVGCE